MNVFGTLVGGEGLGWVVFALCVGIAWLIGGIPFGFLAGKCRGIDIRKEGSGNIGATNVFRVLGKKWGIFVFALDIAKGAFPVVWVGMFSPLEAGHVGEEWLGLGCGLAAILGHNFTPFLGFRGGKGIATSAGVLLGLMPWVLVVGLTIFAIGFWTSRMVSLGSILAAGSLPISALIFHPGEWPLIGFGALAGALGVWRHRSNIGRILAGTEHRFGQRKEKTS